MAQKDSTTLTAPTPSNPAFIPLESNPVVFNNLAHNLGLSPSLSFIDVYSITDPDLLPFVPHPVYALLLVFPVLETYDAPRQEIEEQSQNYKRRGDSYPVV